MEGLVKVEHLPFGCCHALGSCQLLTPILLDLIFLGVYTEHVYALKDLRFPIF